MAKSPKDLKEEPLVNIRLYDNHSYLETVNHTVAAAVHAMGGM